MPAESSCSARRLTPRAHRAFYATVEHCYTCRALNHKRIEDQVLVLKPTCRSGFSGRIPRMPPAPAGAAEFAGVLFVFAFQPVSTAFAKYAYKTCHVCLFPALHLSLGGRCVWSHTYINAQPLTWVNYHLKQIEWTGTVTGPDWIIQSTCAALGCMGFAWTNALEHAGSIEPSPGPKPWRGALASPFQAPKFESLVCITQGTATYPEKQVRGYGC